MHSYMSLQYLQHYFYLYTSNTWHIFWPIKPFTVTAVLLICRAKWHRLAKYDLKPIIYVIHSFNHLPTKTLLKFIICSSKGAVPQLLRKGLLMVLCGLSKFCFKRMSTLNIFITPSNQYDTHLPNTTRVQQGHALTYCTNHWMLNNHNLNIKSNGRKSSSP